MIAKYVLALCALVPLAVAEKPVPLLLEVDALAHDLQDPNLVLLQVSAKDVYAAKHIAGAQFISLQDVSVGMDRGNTAVLSLELPPVDVLRASLAKFGISNDSHVVVYFDTDQSYSGATRVVFALQYAGLGDRTSLLNGGLAEWVKRGKPVTATVPTVVAGKLSGGAGKNIVADAELVRTIGEHANYKLIDARMPEFYSGKEATYDKNGHIPGAVNIPFSGLADANGLMTREHVAELFAAAGVKPGDTVVTYCHIGRQATVVLFAARLLGNQVMMYDGAFQDWATNNRGPVEKSVQ